VLVVGNTVLVTSYTAAIIFSVVLSSFIEYYIMNNLSTWVQWSFKWKFLMLSHDKQLLSWLNLSILLCSMLNSLKAHSIS